MVKKRRRPLAEKDLEEKWKRALADYDNLCKRTVKEKKELVRLAHAGLIDKLLPILDSLEKCDQHFQDKGLNLVLDQLKKVLFSEGLEKIKVLGRKFNPEKMDAVEMVAGDRDRVVKVVLQGYLLNGKILRPAKVKVGQGN